MAAVVIIRPATEAASRRDAVAGGRAYPAAGPA